jgi:hypothetical protein
VVDLDEFFKVAGADIFIDRSRLELICLGSMLERWCQSTEHTLPDGVMSLTGERHGGVGGLALRHLLSSMTLQRLPRSRPYSHYRRF